MAGTDEINAGCKARVEREKLSEGAYTYPLPRPQRRNLARFTAREPPGPPGMLPQAKYMHVIFCPVDDILAYAFREETSRHSEASVMDRSSFPPFPHRHNKDGSWDSICMKCYLTIATAPNEAELGKFESHHACKGLTSVVSMEPPSGFRKKQRTI